MLPRFESTICRNLLKLIVFSYFYIQYTYLKLAIIFRWSSSRFFSTLSTPCIIGTLIVVDGMFDIGLLLSFSLLFSCFCFHELCELFRAIATLTRPLFWSIAFLNLMQPGRLSLNAILNYLKLAGFTLACSAISFFLVFSSASFVRLLRRLANLSLLTAPIPIPLNLLLAFITLRTTYKKQAKTTTNRMAGANLERFMKNYLVAGLGGWSQN